MPWTIDAALNDEAIERTKRTQSGYSFWLRGIPVEISIVLSVNPVRGGFNFHLNNFIKTPSQAGPYRPSRPWGDDEAYALHLAVTAITQYYNQAIEEGYLPSKEWLVPASKNILIDT